MTESGDDFLALCFQTCERLGIEIRAVQDPDRALTPTNCYARVGEGWRLYLPSHMERPAQREALLGVLAAAGCANAYLPPVIREAIEPREGFEVDS